MKTQKFLLTTFLVLLTGFMAFSQKKTVDTDAILKSGVLPQNLELKDDLQKFVVTTDHFNTDIFGNFFNKMRVKGEYTRGIGNSMVKWITWKILLTALPKICSILISSIHSPKTVPMQKTLSGI
jgi:hypothetical protein